jgi:signal peptidase I
MERTTTTSRYQTEWPEAPAGPPPPRRSRFGFARELPTLLVIAFGLALLMKTLLIQAFFIPSESMVPTLEIGDRVIVNKLAYRFREPRRGEVIVFIARKDTRPRSLPSKIRSFLFEGLGVTRPAETDFIKRLIGLPGDLIEVNERGVFITPPRGRRFRLTEPYILDKGQQGPAQEPFRVPEGRYFVMGDNRANSSDSRSLLGPIRRSDIIGKAFVKIWPPKRAGLLRVPDYATPAPPKTSKPSKTSKPRRGRGSPGAQPVAAPPVAVPAVAFAALRRHARGRVPSR